MNLANSFVGFIETNWYTTMNSTLSRSIFRWLIVRTAVSLTRTNSPIGKMITILLGIWSAPAYTSGTVASWFWRVATPVHRAGKAMFTWTPLNFIPQLVRFLSRATCTRPNQGSHFESVWLSKHLKRRRGEAYKSWVRWWDLRLERIPAYKVYIAGPADQYEKIRTSKNPCPFVSSAAKKNELVEIGTKFYQILGVLYPLRKVSDEHNKKLKVYIEHKRFDYTRGFLTVTLCFTLEGDENSCRTLGGWLRSRALKTVNSSGACE